jgi:hypothetical protein
MFCEQVPAVVPGCPVGLSLPAMMAVPPSSAEASPSVSLRFPAPASGSLSRRRSCSPSWPRSCRLRHRLPLLLTLPSLKLCPLLWPLAWLGSQPRSLKEGLGVPRRSPAAPWISRGPPSSPRPRGALRRGTPHPLPQGWVVGLGQPRDLTRLCPSFTSSLSMVPPGGLGSAFRCLSTSPRR